MRRICYVSVYPPSTGHSSSVGVPPSACIPSARWCDPSSIGISSSTRISYVRRPYITVRLYLIVEFSSFRSIFYDVYRLQPGIGVDHDEFVRRLFLSLVVESMTSVRCYFFPKDLKVKV